MIDCPFTLNAAGLWQCPQCKWVYKLESDKPPRRNCSAPPSLRPAAEKLGIEWEDVPHYAQALAKWTATGFPVRSEEEVERIHEEHCGPCEHNVKDRCKLCRCNVNKSRFALANKIKMKTETCPEEKW